MWWSKGCLWKRNNKEELVFLTTPIKPLWSVEPSGLGKYGLCNSTYPRMTHYDLRVYNKYNLLTTYGGLWLFN